MSRKKVKSVLITAGPTREKIDPVRFISNYSTGTFGYEIAKAARRRGLGVTLVSGPTGLPVPRGVEFIAVESAREMRGAVLEALGKHDCLVMAAAVSDWRVKSPSKKKIKRGGKDLTLELAENPDILREAKKLKGKLLVGFALETEGVERNALKKLKNKGLDIIVANKLGKGTGVFGPGEKEVLILDRFGGRERFSGMPKRFLAKIILDRILSFSI